MRLIGITLRVDTANLHHERRDALDQRWHPFLRLAGLLPILIPNDRASALSIVQKVDLSGLVFSGGNTLMGLPGGDAPERDDVETALLRWACETRKPVIGVCRGMQMIQHYFGGELEQLSGHAGTRHKVKGEFGERDVNSYHTFGCRKSTKGIRVLAQSEDGIIEEVQHEKFPIHAMMWHPERETQFDDQDLAIFKRYFA